MENTRSKDTGGYGGKVCEPCDDCYNLVSDAANEHRKNLADLDELLVKIRESPEPVSQNFVQEIRQLQIKVRGVLADARINSQDQGRGNISTHYFFCVCVKLSQTCSLSNLESILIFRLLDIISSLFILSPIQCL